MNTDPRSVVPTTAALDQLLSLTILFGHQSVGQNIVDGIKQAEALSAGPKPGQTKFLSGDRPANGPGLYSFRIGTNGDPVGKIKDFGSTSFDGVDIAMMKLCYVDFGANTNVALIFQEYVTTIQRLQGQYPETVFVHITVPLVSRETGLKALAKAVLGRPRTGYEDNLQRQRYNEMLRAKYSAKDPVFDLALLEATDPAGQVSEHALNGERYLSLDRRYTTDGGHLNDTGRRHVANALLLQLAALNHRAVGP